MIEGIQGNFVQESENFTRMLLDHSTETILIADWSRSSGQCDRCPIDPFNKAHRKLTVTTSPSISLTPAVIYFTEWTLGPSSLHLWAFSIAAALPRTDTRMYDLYFEVHTVACLVLSRDL